jgi:hypothetical protein
VIAGEQVLDRGAIEVRGTSVDVKIRHIPAALAEILIPRGAFLAIPALLVDEHDRGQQRKPLHREGHMCQVGDGAVSVLEIKSVQELLGTLAADLFQRFLHRERGARIFRHGVGQDFRVGAVNGKNLSLVVAAFRNHRRVGPGGRSLCHGSHAGMLNPSGAENRGRENREEENTLHASSWSRVLVPSLCGCKERTGTMRVFRRNFPGPRPGTATMHE